MRLAAAGLERSAAHPARGDQYFNKSRRIMRRPNISKPIFVNLRQGWKPAGPRPSHGRTLCNDEWGSVHDSPVRFSGGVSQIPNMLGSAARSLIFKFMVISYDINDYSSTMFITVVGAAPTCFDLYTPKNAELGLLVSEQIIEQENIETFHQCFSTLARYCIF